jgi:hypothetical protein
MCKKRFTVQQHIRTKKKSLQTVLQQCSFDGGNKSSDFFRKLNDALVSASILFWVLNNEKLSELCLFQPGSIHPQEKLPFQVLQQYPGNDYKLRAYKDFPFH